MYDEADRQNAHEKGKRAETLESVSSKTVGKVLQRARRRKGNFKDLEDVLDVGKTYSLLSPTCGAPAAAGESPIRNEPKLLGGELDNSRTGQDEQQEFGWEDVADEQVENVALRATNEIAIALDVPRRAPSEEDVKHPKRVTKKERELAQLIHRTHLLCLLGRGMFLDKVANDPLIQASVSSLLPKHLILSSNIEVSPSDENRACAFLRWFHREFNVSNKPYRSNLDAINEMSSPPAETQFVNELRAALLQKSVTVENGCVLFAALLRSLGFLTRIVCVLDPSPLSAHLKGIGLEKLPFSTSPHVPVHFHADLATCTADSSIKHQLEAVRAFAKKSNNQTHRDLPDNNAVCENSKPKKRRRKNEGKVPEKGDSQANNDNVVAEDKNEMQTEPGVIENQGKRKGDQEFEHQLAMALAATAFQSSSKPEPVSRIHEKDGEGKVLPGGMTTGLVYNSNNDGTGRIWVEVYVRKSPADGFRWVHACPALGWFDRCRDVEGLAPKRMPLAYVVAFCAGGAKDVTRRYSLSFIKSEKQREGAWWEETMKPLRAKQVASSIATSGGEELKVMEAREEKELESLALADRRSLPSTVEGFRKHPLFALHRHIGKYQVLRPGSKPLGMHRGEPYYSREDVCDVHTSDRWRRLGRQVVEDEVANPAKRMKKRTITDDKELDNNDCGTSADLLSCFYGYWQTEEWTPPAAKDGKVPKNERGNVEVPPFAAALPIGTVHIQLPNVLSICRKLGIDFAPALVGFEVRGGRSVPVVDGVVICVEHEVALRKAYEEDVTEKAEKARSKRLSQAASNWRALLRAILTRVRLKASYSPGTEMKAEAEAGAMLSFETAYNHSRRGRKNNTYKHEETKVHDHNESNAEMVVNPRTGQLQGEDTALISDDDVEEI